MILLITFIRVWLQKKYKRGVKFETEKAKLPLLYKEYDILNTLSDGGKYN